MTTTHAGPQPVSTAAGVPLRHRLAAQRWRRAIAALPLVEHAYRAGVAVVGVAVVAVGLVTVPLPGPGWLTVMAGLLVLSSEFAAAERLLALTRQQVGRWVDWLRRQGTGVRLALGAATVACTCAATVGVLHVVGVPAWVPDAVPRWQ